jgi:hypothetical protein
MQLNLECASALHDSTQPLYCTFPTNPTLATIRWCLELVGTVTRYDYSDVRAGKLDNLRGSWASVATGSLL